MTANPRPARVVSPGAILKRELEARGWTQQDLADVTGRPAQLLSEIVSGSKRITPETAIQLGEAFGTSAELWMNLDARYQLRKAQEQEETREGAERIRRKSRLYSLAPVLELLKRNWIREGDTLEDLENEVCRFLGIRDLADEPGLAASYRHSRARTPEAAAQRAWARRVETVARFKRGRRYDRTRLRQAVPSLLEFTKAPEGAPRALERLLDLGIGIALVRPLPRSLVDGVAFVVERPIIGLGLRYDRLDHFWFTLMHEVAHLVEGHRGVYIDTIGGEREAVAGEERAANHLASDWLVPDREMTRFLADRPTRAAIVEFSARLGRHPAIVVGQLHFRGVVPYARFRDLLPKVGDHLAGWFVP